MPPGGITTRLARTILAWLIRCINESRGLKDSEFVRSYAVARFLVVWARIHITKSVHVPVMNALTRATA